MGLHQIFLSHNNVLWWITISMHFWNTYFTTIRCVLNSEWVYSHQRSRKYSTESRSIPCLPMSGLTALVGGGGSSMGIINRFSQPLSSMGAHFFNFRHAHYSNVIMGGMASQTTILTIVYSTVYSGTDQRKHQRSALLALCAGNSPVTGEFRPVTREMFPFYGVIMQCVGIICHGILSFKQLINNLKNNPPMVTHNCRN